MVALVVQARRRNHAPAVLHRHPRARAFLPHPAHLRLELRARTVAAIHTRHATLLAGGVGRNVVFDRARRCLSGGAAGQHRSHSDRGHETCPAEHLAARGSEDEHALLAVAILASGEGTRLRLGDRFADAL